MGRKQETDTDVLDRRHFPQPYFSRLWGSYGKTCVIDFGHYTTRCMVKRSKLWAQTGGELSENYSQQ